MIHLFAMTVQAERQLDKIDQQIVLLLGTNGRMSGRELASMLPIDEGATRARIQYLLNSVMSVRTLVNPSKVGFPLRTFLGLKVEPANMSQVMQQLARHERNKYVATGVGTYDVITMIMSQSLQDLEQFLSGTVGKMEGLRRVETNVCLKTHLGHYVYMSPNFLDEVSHLVTELDPIDLMIIKRLAEDSLITAQEISQTLPISAVTAHRRLKRLIDNKIITIRATARSENLGYPVYAIVGLQTELEETSSIASALKAHKQFNFVATCTGVFTLIANGVFKSNRDLDNVLKEFVYPLRGVKEVSTTITLEHMFAGKVWQVPRSFGNE